MDIHISNLGNRVTEESLDATFACFGRVDATIITPDSVNMESRSAMVTMPDNAQADAAILRIHGSVVDGLLIQVRAVAPMIATHPIAPSPEQENHQR